MLGSEAMMTMVITFTVILFSSAFFARSILYPISHMPRRIFNKLFGRPVYYDDNSPDEVQEEEEEEEEPMWQYEEDNMWFRLRYEIHDRLNHLLHVFIATVGYSIERIRRILMLDMELDDKNLIPNRANSREADGRNKYSIQESNGTSQRTNNGKILLHNIVLPRQQILDETVVAEKENSSEFSHQESNTMSGRISYDPNIEPAFLNDEDYPEHWLVYDSLKGELVYRKEATVEQPPININRYDRGRD